MLVKHLEDSFLDLACLAYLNSPVECLKEILVRYAESRGFGFHLT